MSLVIRKTPHTDIAVAQHLKCEIAPMTDEAIKKVYDFEALLLTFPQVDMETDHIFHAGVYARTVLVPANTVITSALIKIPTLLILQGNGIVYIGDDSREVVGYHIIKCGAHRKQAFFAKEDTMATMIFASNAKTVEDAENEFTNEAHLLISRKNKGK